MKIVLTKTEVTSKDLLEEVLVMKGLTVENLPEEFSFTEEEAMQLGLIIDKRVTFYMRRKV